MNSNKAQVKLEYRGSEISISAQKVHKKFQNWIDK